MSTKTDRIKQRMLENAREITRLNARIAETLVHRSSNDQSRKAWEDACNMFHDRYNQLAFPGGYDQAIEQILKGDAAAVEAALCFLECRPYFFRSGYMYAELLRKTKRAPLTAEQAGRLNDVLQRRAEWKALKRIKNAD